ncbi:MAG: biotin--[acetyl-CoA-carboxylase] ligase [Gemmataceae bacterium]
MNELMQETRALATAPREEWQLDTRQLGRRVLVFNALDSTNAHAARMGDDPALDGLILLADEQLAGRGQHGRSWQCPPGSGVLLSAILLPPAPLRRPVLLAAWAAVAVCETIRKTINQQARIKWPNDVLIRGQKVCGILIEQGKTTIAGIGLNVTQTHEDFEEAELLQAGSLAVFSDRPLSTRELARSLIFELDREYDALCQGDLAALESCWKWRTGLLGRPVIIEASDGIHSGRLLEQSFDGVAIETPTGELRTFVPESIKHLSHA